MVTQDTNGRGGLLRMTSAGLYCEAGGFHIDPCLPVHRAVITHAHLDHVTRGCRQYLTHRDGVGLLRSRLAASADVRGIEYGVGETVAGVRLSLHPAGHVLGSAQIRVEVNGEIWVVTGDYRVTPDRTCAAFEPVPCHTMITESTFAHPFFRWPAPAATMAAIHEWWRENQARGQASFVLAYALGKAQRLLAALDPGVGPIGLAGDVAAVCEHYSAAGVEFPSTVDPLTMTAAEWSRALFILPPVARWKQPFPFLGTFAKAMVSGWMLVPDEPARRRVDTGFVLSDHADYDELQSAIRASRAERVGVMHGYIDLLVDDLRARGYAAFAMATPRCQKPPRIPVTSGHSEAAEVGRDDRLSAR